MFLGRSQFGRYQGLCSTRPNYNMPFARAKRLLYHSGQRRVLTYPQIPTKTLGFSHHLLPPRKMAQQTTLAGNILQLWEGVYEDVVVKEVYEGDISQTWNWIHELWRFYQSTLGVTDFMLWRPLDLTDLVYRVRILSITVNGEEMDMTYKGINLREKWVSGTIEVSLKILGTTAPAVGIFASGSTPTGSTT